MAAQQRISPAQIETAPRATSPAVSPTVFVRQSLSVFLAQVLLLGFGILNNFLVADLGGPDGKGSIYLMQLISGIGLIFLNLGLGPASVFYQGENRRYSPPHMATGILSPSLLVGFLPMIVLAPAWHWVAPLLPRKLSAPHLWLALAAIPALTLTWNASHVLLGRGDLRWFNLLRVLPGALFFVGLLGLLVEQSASVGWMVMLWLASVLSAGVVSARRMRRLGAGWAFRWQGYLRDAVRFGWRSHLGAVAQYLQHRVDVVLVGFFLPVGELGIYSLAVSLAEALWHVPHAVATVLLAHVSRSSERSARATPFVCRTTLAITAVLAVSLAALAAWVIPHVLPAFDRSVRVLHWLLPGGVAASVFKVLASDFIGRGRPLRTFFPALTTLGLCAVAGWWVIPHFGILGAAAVATAGYLLNSALSLASYVRISPMPLRDLIVPRGSDLNVMADVWRAPWSGTSLGAKP